MAFHKFIEKFGMHALKEGESGKEIQSLMAVVILGGLLSATVLNLLVIPGIYERLKG